MTSDTLHPSRKIAGKFLNPVPTALAGGGTMLRTIGRLIVNRNESVPKTPLGPFRADPSAFAQPPASGLRVTWLGHSTALIEIDGCRILADPVWCERASPLQFMGPKRFFAPPLRIDDLPPLDAVLVSHDHYDHLDSAAIAALAGRGAPFYCSLGVGKYLQKWGVARGSIHELDWMQSVSLGNGCELTATPSRHFSGRSPWNRMETLWASFVIRGPRNNVFFGADSGWHGGFAEIGERFGPFDLTMLEIGAYDPAWASIHLGPDRAAEAHLALRGRLMMPIHWGLFNLALHAWNQPIERLCEIAPALGIPLFLPRPGLPAEVAGRPLNSEWWRRKP